jgi:hypothetical protein
VRPEKYDETCDVSLALAKYGPGLPWYRLARLQENFGVLLPESIQFERCEAVADAALPVFLHLRLKMLSTISWISFCDLSTSTTASRLKSSSVFDSCARVHWTYAHANDNARMHRAILFIVEPPLVFCFTLKIFHA